MSDLTAKFFSLCCSLTPTFFFSFEIYFGCLKDRKIFLDVLYIFTKLKQSNDKKILKDGK